MKTIKPTAAQKFFGKDFGNASRINERPDNLRSADPDLDKKLFRQYKALRRQQTKVIKSVLR